MKATKGIKALPHGGWLNPPMPFYNYRCFGLGAFPDAFPLSD
jgi:hypothetical protein